MRMSRMSVQIISAKHPEVAGRLLEHVARKLETNQRDLKTGERYRPEIVTIAIVPATDAVQTTKLPKFAAKLRNALERLGKGSAFILDEKAAEEVVPEGFRRVETAFYRSKLTSWMTRLKRNTGLFCSLAIEVRGMLAIELRVGGRECAYHKLIWYW